ncbi:MAG: basic secretory protein-like protein [Bacteroidota bacterium]
MKTNNISRLKGRWLLVWGVFMTLVMLFVGPVDAQYFGKNKPGYEVFDFDVYQTPNFELYHYFTDTNQVIDLAKASEQWYAMHYTIFQDTFLKKNPMIFYQDHADFQQTNTTFSNISVGTGGFTEGLKNRVVMPMAPTRGQTDHVLGHEMVHAFQYNMFINDSTLGLRNMQQVPLWMIEGMAEYLSIGSHATQTSMWMRDAVLNDAFPTLEEMTRNPYKYNPYRYGHAFWAFVGKMWGDSIIKPLLIATAKTGLNAALDSLVGFNAESVGNMWKMATLSYYKSLMGDTVDVPVGKKLLFDENAGRMNISPAISPDGKYVAFLSEKDLFSIDLYLADAKTGKILKKLSSTIHESEIDAFNYIESSGTWSPDNQEFAFVVFSKGRNQLALVDVKKGKIKRNISFDELQSLSNPNWSPDGKSIVFSGMKNGNSNIYLYELESEKLIQLTDNPYSNIQPWWSPDGGSIVFVTDRPQHGQNGKSTDKFTLNLAIFDLNENSTRVLDIFPGSDNLNPVFDSAGHSIYFLSDRDGFRNLYNVDLNTGKVYQLTSYLTGISGITMLSPALSISKDNHLTYSHYYNQNFSIYRAPDTLFRWEEVDPLAVDMIASELPPRQHRKENIVDRQLAVRPRVAMTPQEKFKPVPYRPKFKLDYISNSGIGFGTSRFGTAMAGSVSAIFSDVVGDNTIFSSLSLNGEIYDFGGQATYFNQKRRINWGASVSHIPYRYGYYSYELDTLTVNEEEVLADNYALHLIRLFETRASLFTFFPISTTRRIEAGVAYARYNYRIDKYNNYYDALGIQFGANREKLPSPDGFSLWHTDVAYVFDNSYFGITSPLEGRRARYSVEKNFGRYTHYTTLFDFRKYFFFKPVGFAFRFYNYSRWNFNDPESRLTPLYVGYPWLVRGYDNVSYQSEQSFSKGDVAISQLTGTHMQVVNAEIRIPFTGPKRLSLISSKWLLTDLAFFFDAGLAWDKQHQPEFKWRSTSINDRIPVFSAGGSLRINMFGYLVIEPYYAFPFQRADIKNGVFGINFTPGW